MIRWWLSRTTLLGGFAALTLGLAACSGPAPEECTAGTDGCACQPDQTCDAAGVNWVRILRQRHLHLVRLSER